MVRVVVQTNEWEVASQMMNVSSGCGPISGPTDVHDVTRNVERMMVHDADEGEGRLRHIISFLFSCVLIHRPLSASLEVNACLLPVERNAWQQRQSQQHLQHENA